MKTTTPRRVGKNTRRHSDITINDKRAGAVEKRAQINYSNTTSGNPAAWLTLFNQNSTGVPVNRVTAMMCDPVFKGVNIRTSAVAKCRTYVYKRDGNNRTIDTTHPAYKLVRYRPNRFQRAYDFKQQMVMHLILSGNAYAIIIRDNVGRPIELLPVLPECVTVFTAATGRYYNATLYYTNSPAVTYTVDSSMMLHVTSMSYDGIVGVGLIDKAREAIGQLLAMQQYAGVFYKNSARPDVVITHPAALDETARVKLADYWKDAHAGVENQFKTVVLDEGMDVKTMASNARDNQTVEMWQQCVRSIANFLSLPPSKLGDNSRNAYNSLEQDALASLADCYSNDIINFDEAYTEKLISTKEQDEGTHEIASDMEPLMVADMAARATALNKLCGVNTPILTQDEGRIKLGLNTRGGTADELPAPTIATDVTATDTGTADTTTKAADEEDTVDEAARIAVWELYDARTKRAADRTAKELIKAHAAGGSAAAFLVLDTERDNFRDMTAPERRAVAAMARRDIDSGEIVFRSFFTAVSRAAVLPPESFSSEIHKGGQEAAQEIADHAKRILFQRN